MGEGKGEGDIGDYFTASWKAEEDKEKSAAEIFWNMLPRWELIFWEEV
jgi:hypothetical protein